MFKWERKKNTWGGEKKDLFLYKGNFIPGLCTLFPSPFLFISSVGCHICCGKKAYLTRQAAILQLETFFFCSFFFSQSWEESSASAPFGNCRLYFAIFSLSLSDGDVFSHYSFLFSCLFFFLKKRERWHFLSCSLWVVLMFSLSWTEKKVIKKNNNFKLSSLFSFCDHVRKHIRVPWTKYKTGLY